MLIDFDVAKCIVLIASGFWNVAEWLCEERGGTDHERDFVISSVPKHHEVLAPGAQLCAAAATALVLCVEEWKHGNAKCGQES